MPSLVFNALSGTEMKLAILADIEKRLDASGEFGAHVAFPWVKYTFEIGLTVYPKQQMDDPAGIVVKGELEAGTKPDSGEPNAPIVLVGGEVVDVPNETRIASDQPIPTPAPGPGGVLVDKMQLAVTAVQTTKPKGTAMGLREPTDGLRKS